MYFLLVNVNVVFNSLRADSWPGTIGSQRECSYLIMFLLLIVLSAFLFPGLLQCVSFCYVYGELLTERDWVSQRGSSLLSWPHHHTHTSILHSCSLGRENLWENFCGGSRSEKESDTRSIWRMRTWKIAMNNFQKCLKTSLPYSMPLISASLFLSQSWISVHAANLVIFNSWH